MRQLLNSILLLMSCLGFVADLYAEEGKSLTFEADIRPIFRAHCFDCHGATDEMDGKLDLRLVRFLITGGESGPSIVPGDPSSSYLLDRIKNGEMPPGDGRIPDHEIQVLTDWIKAGAPTARPEPESIGPGLGITIEERSHWAYQPIKTPVVHDIASYPPEKRVRTPIDALLGDNVEFAPDASRRVLVMRAYFDLLGLPPSPEEVVRWEQDPGADWFDRMISELLSSDHYGEHWGRHWLDVAGYADSEGYTVADAERLWAWKYRDWVIKAFNRDQPFNEFITYQLAGDELAGPINGDLTEEQIEKLTATGFLRMAADGTGSGANNPEGQNQVIADTLKIIGTSLLGLSLQCAQCHDHRYDPVPQTDYYAIRAIFEPALDWKSWKVPNARRISLYTAADRVQAAQVEAEVKKVAAAKATKLAEYMQQALAQELQKYEEPLRTQLKEAYETAGNKRTPEQKELLKTNPSINITPGNLYQYIEESKPKLADFDAQIKKIREKKPAEEFLRALIEPPKHQPETKLFHRGDFQQPKQTIMPAVLSVATPEDSTAVLPANNESLPTTGRRLAFANWLTSADNPLFARVIVNRVWMHHFGKGLVATPADFGKLGTTPSHPELLDWLAIEFIKSGWSLKKLHRLIMSSTAWQQKQSNNHEIPNAALQRLTAESLRDRVLAVSGQLDPTLYGKPLKIKEDETGQVIVDANQPRRSLYIQVRRSRPVGLMQTFDAPVMETNCELRSNSTVATQSLMLLNGQFILDQASLFAARIAKEAPSIEMQQFTELPALPPLKASQWEYGYGSFSSDQKTLASFTALPHWTGSSWQGGASLPDPKIGWAILNQHGGHPDVPERSVIRRWTAPAKGSITISGELNHPSENGDGVRGRVVFEQSGLQGEWTALHGTAATKVSSIKVQAGEKVSFVVDCRDNTNSDSFSWPVDITFSTPGSSPQNISSVNQFSGPAESVETVPAQIVRAWQLAYCRKPSVEELKLALNFVGLQLNSYNENPKLIPSGKTGLSQAMTNLCQSLLSSNEFLYVE